MAGLRISLLGPLTVTRDTTPIKNIPYDKARALLAYLVAEADRPHRREVLAELFWPDQDERSARHNLSQALFCLRRAIESCNTTPALILTRSTVQFACADAHVVDVWSFRRLLQASRDHRHPGDEICRECTDRLCQAAALYRGDFLDQLTIPDCPEFEEWVLLNRERLRREVLEVYDRIVGHWERTGNLDEARRLVEQQIAIEPSREQSHRHYMRLLALSGQRNAALAQYERCRQILESDLGVEPEPATNQLYAQIRAGELEAGAVPAWRTLETRPRSPLPSPLTPFVGREAELGRIRDLFGGEGVRLVTLMGIGGIGKTRLAIQAANDLTTAFAEGVCYVSLVDLPSAKLLVPSIAHALSLSLTGREAPRYQLAAFLHDKELLLVLDNFEHLLDGAIVIQQLLIRAPRLRALVTSRERLNLQGEAVINLDGLDLPVATDAWRLQNASAVRLFVETARRVGNGFAVRSDDLPVVAQICRLVDGLPLGIELAASWTSVLTCDEIARQIETSLDFLASTTRDLPERHRSIRVVMDSSWSMLDRAAQPAFAQLSLFRGGFTRAAAESVAGVSLPVLADLVEKSLLRRGERGRFEIHELLRQYAATRLATTPAEASAAGGRHATYFLKFLAQCTTALEGHRQPDALGEVGAEIDNIRTAWSWSVQSGQFEALGNAVHGLWLFSEIAGRYLEAVETLEEASEAMERILATDSAVADDKVFVTTFAKIIARQGSFYIRLGRRARGDALIDRALEILVPQGSSSDLGLALNFKAMQPHARQDYANERHLLQESVRHFEAAGDRWGLAYSLNDLGLAEFLLGDVAKARAASERSLHISRETGDQRGMAFALRNLGVFTALEGNFHSARRSLDECLALRRSLDSHWGIADALVQLGIVARSSGHPGDALGYFVSAFETADRIKALDVGLEALVELVDVLDKERQNELAIAILSAVIHLSANEAAVSIRAERKLRELGRESLTVLNAETANRLIHESIRILGDQGIINGGASLPERAASE